MPESERARVLLVDDDERNLLAVATVLEDLGEVVLARSGEEALRHLLKGEFAVILLDVYMPGMDGYETAQIIRTRRPVTKAAGIPIVFLYGGKQGNRAFAARLFDGCRRLCLQAGFRSHHPACSKVSRYSSKLFEKTKEVERKARHEQALLDANLRANAERLRAEQEACAAPNSDRRQRIIQSLSMVLYLEPYEADPALAKLTSAGTLKGSATGFNHDYISKNPDTWAQRHHPGRFATVSMTALSATPLEKVSLGDRISLAMPADGNYKYLLDQQRSCCGDLTGTYEFAGTLTDVTRPAFARKPAGPGPEDGRDRQAHRGHCPRLQQSARGSHWRT